MLKKFKILLFLIILFLIGIVCVISIWLYGSYVNNLEVVNNEVERSLFNTVQSYYESQDSSIVQNQRKSYRRSFDNSVIAGLLVYYPAIDSNSVKEVLDMAWRERYIHYHGVKHKADSVRTLVPPFVLQQMSFNKETLIVIDSLLQLLLGDKNMRFDVEVTREQIIEKPRGRGAKFYMDSLGLINTRPILINPSKDYYLVAKFKPPMLFLFSKMFWQIAVAFLLVLGLIGTFAYLFWTISIQNKMGILRKSFVSNMTHELKTPVATVMAAIEAVQRFGAKDDKEKMNRYLQISQNEMTHLSDMIEKVLQLNIDEVSGIVLQRTYFDLLLLIKEVIESSKISSKKKIYFTLKYPNESITMFADTAHLKNVFRNLFDNAIKYSGSDVHIEVAVRKKGKFVLMEVADNGIGVADNFQKNIFEMFFRVPAGDRHDVKGFGLGLAYVKLVVEQHGGSIKVSSVLNKGTIFIVSLPQ